MGDFTEAKLVYLITYKEYLTKVFSRGAVLTKDCDNTGPEHLQGGHVGRKDTKCTSKCWHVDLFHTGFIKEHLEEKTHKQHIYFVLKKKHK